MRVHVALRIHSHKHIHTYTHYAPFGRNLTKRAKSKIFPRSKEPVDSIKMTLGNLFSAQDIAALKSVATAQTDAEKYTTHISEEAWTMLYDIAANLGQKLSPKWWQTLDEFVVSNTEVVVCMRGKRECEIMSVTRQAYWAKHLGQMLKSGYSIVWLGKYYCTEVTWDNWKWVYAKLTAKPDTQEYDPEMSKRELRELLKARRDRKKFHEAADVVRIKKNMVPTTMEEALFQRRSVEYTEEINQNGKRDIAITPIVRLANEIIAMV